MTEAHAEHLRRVSRNQLHYFFTDFGPLDTEYAGSYPRLIAKGEGAYLYDVDDHRVLDASQHLSACIVGHARHEIADRIGEQLRLLEQCSFDGGMSHLPVAELIEKLRPVLNLKTSGAEPMFFFSTSGSEAVETAFKIARSYHALRGEPARTKVLARVGSFHGMTLGALAATGNAALREPYGPLPPGFVRVSQPSPGRCGFCTRADGCNLQCADDIERVIKAEGEWTIAALIGEPVVMHMSIQIPHEGYWPRVREICDRYGLLLITDEVVTGFGRTGKLFGSEHWNLQSDIIVLGKGLTSGYIPMAATITAGHVARAFTDRRLPHSSTFGGHPAACVAALSSIEIIEREDLVGRTARLEAILREELETLKRDIATVRATTVIGLLASAEFEVADASSGALLGLRLRHECYKRGLLIRMTNDSEMAALSFYPPLIIEEDEIKRAFTVLRDASAAVIDGVRDDRARGRASQEYGYSVP